jgi:DNA-binding CsgD family transcriptional regulator/PAS domain-containing protein
MHDSVFDSLVAGFYRAATGAIEWSDALTPVQEAFRARAAVLHSVDMRSGQMMGFAIGGSPMHEHELDYLRTYQLLDPRRAKLMAGGESLLGRWWHCNEHFKEAFVERDRFYAEFLPAVGSRYQSTVVLQCSEHVLGGLALELPAHRGVLDPDEREAARRLGIHMQDALRAYERVRSLMAQTLAGHTLLQSFPYPMWLIDSDRYVHFANPAAARATAQATVVVQRGQHLAMTATRTDRQFMEHLLRLRSAPHGATVPLDLRSTVADSPVWLHLSLLIPQAVLGAFGERPLILATLFDPQQVSTLDPFALAAVLNLTPAQARVASQLADGLTAEQISEINGTSPNTVRAHVRGLLDRLGVQRTVDVVRLLRQGESLWATQPTGHR